MRGIVVPPREDDFTADPVELFFDLAYVFAFWQVGRSEARHEPVAPATEVDDSAQWPFSSPRTQLAQKCTRPDALDLE